MPVAPEKCSCAVKALSLSAFSELACQLLNFFRGLSCSRHPLFFPQPSSVLLFLPETSSSVIFTKKGTRQTHTRTEAGEFIHSLSLSLCLSLSAVAVAHLSLLSLSYMRAAAFRALLRSCSSGQQKSSIAIRSTNNALLKPRTTNNNKNPSSLLTARRSKNGSSSSTRMNAIVDAEVKEKPKTIYLKDYQTPAYTVI